MQQLSFSAFSLYRLQLLQKVGIDFPLFAPYEFALTVSFAKFCKRAYRVKRGVTFGAKSLYIL